MLHSSTMRSVESSTIFNSIFPYLNAYIDLFFLNKSGLFIRTLFFDQEFMPSQGLFMVDCHEPQRSRIQLLVICIVTPNNPLWANTEVV